MIPKSWENSVPLLSPLRRATQRALFSSRGNDPRMPVGDCGLPAAPVVTALNALRWQPVSARLIVPVPSATATPNPG
jgi:hypothetical protein